jgi:hypothetical protein
MTLLKKITGISASVLLATGVLAGCGNEEATSNDTSDQQAEQHVDAPTLEAEFVKDGNTVTINWNTSLTVSAEHYGGDHVDGEGHAHVYVDGEKVAGLKSTDSYVVEGLSEGKHKIELTLQKNSHDSYEVTEVFEVVVGEEKSAEAPTLEAEFVQVGNVVTINWNTSLNISAEHYGSDHVDGEGHAHVYVDGEKVAGLKNTAPYIIEDLSKGMHTIEIALQQNDHTAYEVLKSFDVEVQ